MKLWTADIHKLTETLRAAETRRAYLITDPREGGGVIASHIALKPLADALASDTRDFDAHEGVFFEIGEESGLLMAAFIHKTRRGQAAGGLRFWTYATVEDLVRDGLRLSRGMGHKSSLAGLWWGGGKGIIARDPQADGSSPEARRRIYGDYGRFTTGLRGCYITAEDVGTTPADMAYVFSQTRHCTCIPAAHGGSGNPSGLTARGVVVAMEAGLAHLGRGSLAGTTVVVQGLGNVASFIVGELLERGVSKILGSDVDERRLAELVERFPQAGDVFDLRRSDPDDLSILSEPCDVLAPCAIGGVLRPDTIAAIRAPLVCGAANNQLEDPARDARDLQAREILYIPDFLANRMGIVNCANEQYGVFDNDPAVEAHLQRETSFGVYQRTLEVIGRAAETGRTPTAEAELLADELAEEQHPIWGHRGRQIIDRLVAEGWERGPKA
ncbi:MAG: Glu/Leu/Phe/Val dehydrogenase dimerization domain-containing protein [Acidobacteriota bacterium]